MAPPIRDYYARWLAKALSRPFFIAAAVAGALRVIGAAIESFRPEWSQAMELWVWAVPVTVFALALIVSIFVAPYLIYCEMNTLASKTKDDLRSKLAEQQAELDAYRNQRARLEIRFEPKPPYRLESSRWYRVGVYNCGPAQAEKVKARLLHITPENPFPEDVLDRHLTWKDGGLERHIDARQEPRLLDVMQYESVNPPGRGTTMLVRLWLERKPDSFEAIYMKDYHLHLEVSAKNADPVRAEFVVRRDGRGVAFFPAGGSTSS